VITVSSSYTSHSNIAVRINMQHTQQQLFALCLLFIWLIV